MTGQILFAGAALFGIAVVVFLTPLSVRARSMVTVLAVLPVPVLLAIGWQRAVFGLDSAASPRYQYMTAMVLAVPFALAIDQLRRLDRRALVVGWAVVGLALLSNVRLLVERVRRLGGPVGRCTAHLRTRRRIAGRHRGNGRPDAGAGRIRSRRHRRLAAGARRRGRDHAAHADHPEELALVAAILAGTPRP